VSLGDADGDGDLDLAAGLAHNAGIVSVWTNQGDGNFAELTVLSAERDARMVWWADLNGDGYRDLAVWARDPAAQKLCSLLNDGTGILLADQVNYDLFNSPMPFLWIDPYQIEFVDLDQDGDQDVVVLNEGQPTVAGANIATLLNQGDGTFAEAVHVPIDGFFPTVLVMADIDADGYEDAIIAGPENTSVAQSPGYVGLLLNDGSGSLAISAVLPTGGSRTRAIAVRDVTGDLHLDVIAVNFGTHDLSVLANDGNANLALMDVQPTAFLGPAYVATGDLNGDDQIDVALTKDDGTRGVYVMFGDGHGTFPAAGPLYEISPDVGRVALADFDADCDLDLIVSSSNIFSHPVTFTLLSNDGTGTFVGATEYWQTGTRSASVLRSIDVDQDGWLDVIVATAGAASVFPGNGDGSFRSGVSYGSGDAIQGIAAADLDGDGDIDIGTANVSGDTYSILWNRRCTPGPTLSPADLDGDGDVGLEDWAVFVTCVGGPNTCQTAPACNPPGTANADVDSDGDVDLRDARILMNAVAP